ncbi:uncharacterized protein LOC110729284 [Chenopodium quinoa]|uniref:uncharacterized protein LOC110729284 n=1 Tax=Chenopodium quinoa TaxID=63459 RepID=UPI000B777055|nr:uncharacterized protein LOC110729284 [Chenopodium quinoa]XP_021764711.1 uncharacterized protein LOC110729284 [Chenopodium quinoa]XP_021764716.1 uncharacterized protein LOC110729284 [Chenopodium quinoa]XP_021764719.1 uncharacterized protein LOC110729284 [Chenopodium quinoa]XP_021764723.1 uncharacterized protein LOC110729284 [Chenopodium quinoa]
MTKKKTSIRGSGDQHLEIHEPRITEYERLRLERIEENMSKMQELGLKDKAMSLAIVKNSRGNCSKHKMNNISAEDGLYRPNQDTDMEHELDSSDEELFIPHSKSNLKSRNIPWKKRRQKVDLASSHGGSSTSQQPVETLGSEVEHLNQNKNDKENGEKDKPRRGPTMCYNVHGRSEEEHLGITLNEHGQPVGHHDDKTCNEFTSFLGTIA